MMRGAMTVMTLSFPSLNVTELDQLSKRLEKESAEWRKNFDGK